MTSDNYLLNEPLKIGVLFISLDHRDSKAREPVQSGVLPSIVRGESGMIYTVRDAVKGMPYRLLCEGLLSLLSTRRHYSTYNEPGQYSRITMPSLLFETQISLTGYIH